MSRSNKEKYDPPNPRRSHSYMSTEDVASGKRSHWPELEITGLICNLSPQLWKLNHLTSLYLNDNNLTMIPPDIARLSSLMYLDLSSNQLHILPSELGDLIMLRELLVNNNLLRHLPYELGKLFQLQHLGLSGNPLAMSFLNVYREPNGTLKLLSYLLDNLSVTSTQPPARPWVSIHNPSRNQPACKFTVMCYNVLCDKYATRQMYGYCPNWALNWEYRRKAIMDEIRHYSADIISLQEVETEQYYNMFLPELRKDGYDGIFSPKSRAKTMNENDRKYVDGCAIFFRANKFRIIKEHLVEFTQLAMANAEGSDDMLNRVMTKDNIGLAAVLETREGAWENSQVPVDPSHVHQPLLVCTAHIHWDPEYCDVKLIQTMMLMNELRGIVEESSRSFRPRSHKPNCNAMPLLLCGDFNSLPDSGVIEFLTSGRISSSHADLKQLGYKACLQKINTSEKPNEYTHSFKMARAYSDENMPFTNYTFDFKGIIDYILHSETLKPIGLLGPLDLDWLRIHKVVGCPHPHVPSDHLPLLVEYEMLAQQPPLTNGLVVQR